MKNPCRDIELPDGYGTDKKFFVFCQWCGEQDSTSVRESLILPYICNTECKHCGKILAKIEWNYD